MIARGSSSAAEAAEPDLGAEAQPDPRIVEKIKAGNIKSRFGFIYGASICG
jgi:hypothetical protein